jgi:two-component system cell cycle sensor histidine kinase/response regulator CckA
MPQQSARILIPTHAFRSWNQMGTIVFEGRTFEVRGRAMAAILIVEDEAQVRVLSESFLQEQGHQTLSAATPDEALAVLEGDIDCLFTDIELRGDLQAGIALAQAAITKQPGLRVLYTSCHTVTDGLKALFVENSAFLPKPYTIDQLQAILAVDFAIKPHPAPTAPPGAADAPRPSL